MSEEQKRFDLKTALLLIFAVAILAAAGYFIYQSIKTANIGDLKTNGKVLETTFASIEINWKFKINNQSPYQIHSFYLDPATQEVYYFKSQNLWRNPDGYVSKMIKVYVDPNNYHKYWMDTSFLEGK